MRNNQPVNSNEYFLPDGAAIISRTDAKGIITHCNEEFIQASGFTREELIGQAHNLIRHPDMPEEGFRDFWDTIKRGRTWVGMVKNRRKDGSYYWVQASAAPLPDGSGYCSVRTKARPEDVQEAEALYQRMRSGEKIQLYEGAVLPSGRIRKFFTKRGSLRISTQLWLTSLSVLLILMAYPALAYRLGAKTQLVQLLFLIASFG